MIQFQEYLQSDYPGFASFIDTIIKPIFGDNFKAVTNIDDMIDCLKEDPEELEYYDEIAKSTDESLKALAEDSGLERVLKLGTIQVQGDTRPIYVYDITVSKRRQLSRNRKGIQQLIARTLNNQSGAFMLFHYGDADWEWRFSYKFVGKDKEDTTNSKRYTYLLGRDQVCKTAAQRFTNLLNKKGKIVFDDITDAFSVEKVSKEFFDHYRSIYADIICYVTGKRMVKAGSKWEEKQEHEPNAFIMQQFDQFTEPEKSVRDYVKKLMGRLVFLQFIQKKGWLGVPADDDSWTKGDKDFVQNLFARCENKDTFIDDVLEPLFADINNRREGDIANSILGEDIKVPYLNGGLFEKDAEDETAFPLPAHYMDEMLNEFFSAYNFTIDENDPSDAEVGVDPEMLGRVFENLLEDNKDKGAFYTPKEIVQYMCRESLIAYLQTPVLSSVEGDIEDTEIKESIRNFVTTHEISALKSSEVFKVDKKLREVKICDPAIGSGAFPMGLLKELFDCRMAIEGNDEGKTPADIKKDIIQNSIYGVDIEKGAVDIARLRFWLSLIIDEQTPHALPNMDFKIMQGNSLLEQYKGVPLDDIYDSSRQMMLAFDEETTARMLLKEHMFSYFEKEDHAEKARILESIDNAVKSLVKAKTLGNPEVCAAIDALDLRNNQEFFLWHTWFHDVLADKKDAKGKTIKGSGGFDIVIGNPPYIQLQNDGGLLGNLYKPLKFETFAQTGDIYSLFYEHGVNLLKEDGVLCYITSNKWMRAAYGEKTRQFFAKKTNPMLLIDFAAMKIFENATVETNILLLSNSKNQKATKCVIGKNSETDVLSHLNEYVQENTTELSFANGDKWIIMSGLEASIAQKINKNGVALKDWDINIFRGVLTGFNDAFIVNSEKRDEILAACTDEEKARTNKLIYPILRGKDIKRYTSPASDLFLINTHNGLKNKLEPVDINEFPALKRHLDCYKDKLFARADKGFTPYNLRNCAYLLEFNKNKMLWKRIGSILRFTYDDTKSIGLDSTCFATGEHIEYLCCILNSKMGHYLLKDSPKTGTGDLLISVQAIEPIKIPKPDKETDEKFKALLQRMIESPSHALEHEIDLLVYDLYGLTPEEIAIVEGTNNA